MAEKPMIAITQGDPCGIGPEVVAKALAGGEAYDVARPVVIGCVESLESGVAASGAELVVPTDLEPGRGRYGPPLSRRIRRRLTLLSGPLRVVHIFDHIPLEDVCRRLSPELVHRAVTKTHESLSGWGIPSPRIGVSGLNPHAVGSQERHAIYPGVERARAEGIDAAVAVKTWGFVGNCALFLGAPYLFLSVGHGTAFDIVGRGVADASMILTAILQAASLASGRGFLNDFDRIAGNPGSARVPVGGAS